MVHWLTVHWLRRVAGCCGIVLLVGACTPATPDQGAPPPAGGPPGYLGLDSYLHWDKLPYLEVGDLAAGQSTADPDGTNNDNRNILGTLPDGERVLFERTGRGVVTFLRMQQDIGGPWHLTQDGVTSTVNAPDLGRVPVPFPLSFNTGQSQGSSILATALPYASNLRFTSSTGNGNFYSLYRKLPVDMPLPRQDAGTVNRVVTLLRTAGTDVAPTGIPERHGVLSLGANGSVPVTSITGSQQIRAITFDVPRAGMVAFGNARLRIYWNGEKIPSVDAPVKFLAGDGAGVYQPVGRQLVAGFPSGITTDGHGGMRFSLYWPMPFFTGARIELVSGAVGSVPVGWSVRYQPFTDPPSWVGTFHANYTTVPVPKPGQDMTFLDYHGSGKLVGTVLNFGAVGPTLEGDPHIYLDDSPTPQIAGTGTEEWGMGGDYWNNGVQTSLPLAGLPSATNNPPGTDVDGAAEYRFLIADSVPFSRHIVVNWEHGARNDATLPYRATMLWYGNPAPAAVRTDQVQPTGPGWTLTSGYEDTVTSRPVTGRVTATGGSTSFTLALRPDNVGAFLRRTLDSCVADQRANVFVAGRFAGTWDDPGGSPPAGGRCWRDDDFPLPRSLTVGRRAVTVTIDNVSPGTPWTSAGYQLFAFLPR